MSERARKAYKTFLTGNRRSVCGRTSHRNIKEAGKHLFLILCAVMLSGIGASVMIKAQLGVNAYDALTVSLSQVCGLQIGTISMIMNLMFFLFQILILRKDTEPERFLQIPLLLVLGTAINFMTYEVLAEVTIVSYPGRLIMFFGGLLLCAGSCAVLMRYKIGFPPESFCQLAAQKSTWRFSRLRQLLDILCILLILLLSIGYSSSINIREGTLFSMLLLGPMIEIGMKRLFPKAL